MHCLATQAACLHVRMVITVPDFQSVACAQTANYDKSVIFTPGAGSLRWPPSLVPNSVFILALHCFEW
jgi:hypothetical protein